MASAFRCRLENKEERQMKTTAAIMLSAVIVLLAPNAMSSMFGGKPVESTTYDTEVSSQVHLSSCIQAAKIGVLIEQRTSTTQYGEIKIKETESYYLTEDNLFGLQVRDTIGLKDFSCVMFEETK